jgi:hypothetical protein
MTTDYEQEKCKKCGEPSLIKKLTNISFSVGGSSLDKDETGTIVKKTITELLEDLQSEKEKLKNTLWQDGHATDD